MSIEAVLSETFELIRCLRGVDQSGARSRVAALAARHAPLRIHLICERNQFTGELDHGALIRTPGGESVYVTARAASATPWLLHQVHHFREGDLLSVDGEVLTVGEALAALDEVLAQQSLQERLVDACILRHHIGQSRAPVSDEELQSAVDELRLRRGLRTVEATERWMSEQSMSHERLESLAELDVRIRKLRQEICAREVEPYFAGHRDELARAALARLWFASAELARDALAAARAGAAAFFALASRLLAEDARLGDASARLDSTVVARAELDATEAAQIFERVGAVAGPFTTPRGAYLAYVVSLEPARELDAPTRDIIERRLFKRWLAARRAGATIEWNWGHDDGGCRAQESQPASRAPAAALP